MKNVLATILSLLITPFLSFSQPAPNFQVMDTNGEIINLYEDYLDQGKTVLLEFFWDGCPNCNAFAPLLGDLYEDWGSGAGQVEFIALNTQAFERNENVIAFQERHNHSWPGVSMEGGSLGASLPYREGEYGPYFGDPTIIIISPDRTVNYSPNGFKRDQEGLDILDTAIRATGALKPTDDLSGPVFTTEPATFADINCKDVLPMQQQLSATDPCGAVIIATVDAYEEDLCNGYSITYRWTAVDTCDNSTIVTRTFNVVPDTLTPVFDKEPSPIANVPCGQPNPEPEVLTASSFCGAARVTFSIDNYTPNACTGNTITYRWTATSACGKTAETSRSFITTYDRQAPVFNSLPDTIADIRCSRPFPSPQTLTATTGCTDVTVAFSVDDYEENYCNGFPVTYRWTASDACERTTVITRTFNVLPDDSEVEFNRDPSQFSDISCGTTFPNPENLTAFSRCINDIPVTFTVERSSEEPCGRTITYRWVALDPCGNELVKTSSFRVEEAPITTKDLTGVVTNPKNEGVSDVTLSFSGATSTSVTTNSQGQFTVPNLPIEANYTVRPSKEGDIGEGVTTFDLVQISSHILGVVPFTDDTQFIAADVNLSNSVTSFDIVLIRKVILGIDNSFEAGSWRFLPEQIELNSLAAVDELSFTAIKIGDVTGANNFTSSNSKPRNSTDKVDLVVLNKSFQKEEIIEATFQTDEQTPLAGFQFTLAFDPSLLQLQGIENIALRTFDTTNTNLLKKDSGYMTLSWFDLEQVSSGALFKVRFKAIATGQLQEVLQLNSAITKAEAYTSTREIIEIDLQFQEPEISFEKAPIFPNPTQGTFTLQTYLNQKELLQLEVVSVEGKIVYQAQYEADQSGLQTIPISLSSVPSGMYWIKILDEHGQLEIKKLVKE